MRPEPRAIVRSTAGEEVEKHPKSVPQKAYADASCQFSAMYGGQHVFSGLKSPLQFWNIKGIQIRIRVD